MAREYVYEELAIDIPRCSRTWGVGACTAVLSALQPRKCWNLRKDCAVPAAYVTGAPLTLKFCKDGPKPLGVVAFPVLESINASSPTVNIAGSNPELSSFGKSAHMDATIADFTYHERGIDPYQSERVSGAAQFSGVGYDPAKQGTFLNKLKARWVYYSKAECRYTKGYLLDGVLTDPQVQYFQLSELDGPNDGSIRARALGVLDLANAKTALAPKPSKGRLTLDLTAVATTFSVTPAGVGNSEYPSGGWVCLGSEVMAFTRVADAFTITRGQRGTTAKTASKGDTVQLVLAFRLARLDAVVNSLVQGYTSAPAIYLDAAQIADNAAEVTRWGASIALTTDIVTPTPVSDLLAELSDLGCSVWEDEFGRKIKVRLNRPIYTDVVRKVSDRSAKDIRQVDNDEDRLTQILFMSRRFDPTKSLNDDTNYAVKVLTTDPAALALYGSVVRSRTIRTRWLDQGDESTVLIASLRLLDRFKRAPNQVTITLDAREKAVRLVDVLEVTSDEMADSDGLPRTQSLQVISRSEPKPYHEVKVLCQAFQFDGRYGFIAPNSAPVYGAATAAEKVEFAFISPNATGFPSDNTKPYQVI